MLCAHLRNSIDADVFSDSVVVSKMEHVFIVRDSLVCGRNQFKSKGAVAGRSTTRIAER